MKHPLLIASDLEGVFVPEIWIGVAEKTRIPELRLTTRDIKDYGVLMNHRIKILRENKLTIRDIQEVIATLEPLEGARDFINYIREKHPFVILSDTFYQFAGPFMKKLGLPTLFCHNLILDGEGYITGFELRVTDSKKVAVQSFQSAGFRVAAMGDSYNDTSMLAQAEHGFLFHAPQNVIDEFPQFLSLNKYEDLKTEFNKLI